MASFKPPKRVSTCETLAMASFDNSHWTRFKSAASANSSAGSAGPGWPGWPTAAGSGGRAPNRFKTSSCVAIIEALLVCVSMSSTRKGSKRPRTETDPGLAPCAGGCGGGSRSAGPTPPHTGTYCFAPPVSGWPWGYNGWDFLFDAGHISRAPAAAAETPAPPGRDTRFLVGLCRSHGTGGTGGCGGTGGLALPLVLEPVLLRMLCLSRSIRRIVCASARTVSSSAAPSARAHTPRLCPPPAPAILGCYTTLRSPLCSFSMASGVLAGDLYTYSHAPPSRKQRFQPSTSFCSSQHMYRN